ncbi:MAG: hypothetical protein R2711_03155 [Acidimicrobiales bacterium]
MPTVSTPYLAKAVDHGDTYRIWTIALRPGVVFHDGSKLGATVVKNNLDAYRGACDYAAPSSSASCSTTSRT